MIYHRQMTNYTSHNMPLEQLFAFYIPLRHRSQALFIPFALTQNEKVPQLPKCLHCLRKQVIHFSVHHLQNTFSSRYFPFHIHKKIDLHHFTKVLILFCRFHEHIHQKVDVYNFFTRDPPVSAIFQPLPFAISHLSPPSFTFNNSFMTLTSVQILQLTSHLIPIQYFNICTKQKTAVFDTPKAFSIYHTCKHIQIIASALKL